MTLQSHSACDACGKLAHLNFLDAKPNDPANPDSCDWERLECCRCYGPGYVPARIGRRFCTLGTNVHEPLVPRGPAIDGEGEGS